jgi:aminoglycoside phosphotransferase family enzyme/predicted kinase
MGDLVRDLEAASEQLIETHISWVFLRAREVFKLKKPVDFGFLDFTTLERRERACHAEVELNARLAPGIYRGVTPVTRDEAGGHAIAGQGEVVDFVVQMQRLPEAARADLRLAREELGQTQIDQLARYLAKFHEHAARGERIDEFGRVEVIRQNVEENFAQGQALLRQVAPEAAEREVEQRQLAFLDTRAELFAQRIRAGKIRDGHGDLRLEHVYLDEGHDPKIIDCIEFNERFRYADVCADVAFLSMDLAWHGRADLAERFLATYARATGDYDLYALVDFYESYRAYVRAKVSALSLASNTLGHDARVELEAQARRYLLLALAVERPTLEQPRLIAVGGIIASGKSSLSDALSERLQLNVVSSDETRKRLLGVGATTPLAHGAWQAAYSPAQSAEVYAEVLRHAGLVLASGRSVIVDASFRRRADREAVRQLASSLGASHCFVECQVADEVARARLGARARGPSVSDGRLEIFDEFVASYEPVSELPQEELFRIDSGGSLESSLQQLERAGLPLRAR